MKYILEVTVYSIASFIGFYLGCAFTEGTFDYTEIDKGIKSSVMICWIIVVIIICWQVSIDKKY